MLGTFTNAWKIKDIRKKLLYILLVLLIFRVGARIPLAGIDAMMMNEINQDRVGIIGMLVGGEWGTIFAMGIGPYITASIIMQLMAVAIPALERMKKEGAEGRKKISAITRYLAVVMALLQAVGMVFMWREAFVYDNAFVLITAIISMVAGTMFIMWLSELLTEKGLGNGASFIIFANILSSLPGGIMLLYNHATYGTVWAALAVTFILVLFVFIVAFVVLIGEGQRKIHVEYSKKMVGRRLYGGQSSFIPIKVNLAGVLPIIFAMSILGFFEQVGMFFPTVQWFRTVDAFLSPSSITGAPIYIVLIFAFTFFYASFSINPVEMADNLKKNGGFVPGIRPGKHTSEYIQRVVTRMSWVGAAAYASVAIMPIIMEWVFNVRVGFGGTTIIIVVGVALEIVKKLESQLLMRNYKGFLAA
jgi:preprotein translocase subunit SecY